MTNIEPCKVCGSTEANLVDGYYYCVECGTQDVNVRETVVEEMQLADGTISFKHKKKIYKAAEEDDNLSGEWHKWHAFNFILAGLADEMLAIGAKPTFKKKLLWLWTEYVKKYQNKKELGLNTENEENHEDNQNDDSDSEEVDEPGFYDEELFRKNKRRRVYKKQLKMNTDIDLGLIKRGLFFSLIYIALQLDRNEFYITDLLRFVKQRKLDINNCEKFVPKEIKIKGIPQWDRFTRSQIFPRDMEVYIMSLYKGFEIVPLVPDLKILVHRYAKELCLPNDFKNLVFSLMHLLPSDYLKLDFKVMRTLGRIPLYECIVMAYFLVAFKMMFGLDDDYELKLSDAVDKVNEENCYLKSYNLGCDSEPTDRLFSFREWCNFIQLRKIILCKNYLYMAEYYELPVDHYVFMEQDHERKAARKPTLSDEITMTLLGRIPQEDVVAVIPASEFKATVTPLSCATEVVLQYFNDPDLKLLFTEDFTQYSLKYATEKLYLNDNEDSPTNAVVGISETNKVINKKIVGCLDTLKFDFELVYVRNCNNKNWLKTNQPSKDHIKKIENKSDKESDHGYDSNAESALTVLEISSNDAASVINSTDTLIQNQTVNFSKEHSDTEIGSAHESTKRNNTVMDDSKDDIDKQTPVISESDNNSEKCSTDEISSKDEAIQEELKKELEAIEEEVYDKNIFDDDFEDLVEDEAKSVLEDSKLFDGHPDFSAPNISAQNMEDHMSLPSTSGNQNNTQSDGISLNDSERFFNPDTFDRQKTIKELILATCKKYKIRVPREYSTKEPTKRKSNFLQDGAGESKPKKPKLDDVTQRKRRAERGKIKDEINTLLFSYYENLKHDVLFQVSEHVKSVVNNVSRAHEEATNTVALENERTQDESMHLENTSEHNDTINDQVDLNTESNTDANHPQNDIEMDSSRLESSVQIVGGKIVDDEPKSDPRFDENEYDAKQLYLRVEDEPEIGDVYDVADDPEIAAILDRKIEEVDKGLLPEAEPKKAVTYDSDDDDLPLNVLKAQIEEISQRNIETDKLPPLLTHSNVDEYNYWTRQYETIKLRRAHDIYEPFYVELDKNFPRSFNFVIKECADVIGYTPFRLYRVFLHLEQRLLCYRNLN